MRQILSFRKLVGIVLLLGVISTIYLLNSYDQGVSKKPELKQYLTHSENCGALNKENQPDSMFTRYDSLTDICYEVWSDVEFWKGVNCSILEPSKNIDDIDVAEAMRHNSYLCSNNLVEIKLEDF
jgi:hypothetical protein